MKPLLLRYEEVRAVTDLCGSCRYASALGYALARRKRHIVLDVIDRNIECRLCVRLYHFDLREGPLHPFLSDHRPGHPAASQRTQTHRFVDILRISLASP